MITILLVTLPLVSGQMDFVGMSAGGDVHRIDPLTGCQTLLFSTGIAIGNAVNCLARDSQGFLLAATNVPSLTRFFRIDPRTGVAVLIGTVPVLDVRAMALGGGDEIFVIANHREGGFELDDDLYRVDPATGTRTYVACLGSAFLQSLAYHAGELLAFDIGSTYSGLVRIDPATGSVTDLAVDALLDVQGLAFSPSGRLFGGRTALYEFDPATGAVLSALPLDPGEAIDYRGFEFADTSVVTLDFETEDDLATPLHNGQDLSSPQEFGVFVALSSFGANLGAAAFDSTPGGPNDPSQDRDLLVGLGNLVILQNDQAPTQTAPGTFDRPNDDQNGGVLAFDFLVPAEPLSLDLVDIDLGAAQSASVTLYDTSGRQRHFAVPAGWTGDLLLHGVPGFGRLCLDRLEDQPGLFASATATEEPGFSAREVQRLEVRLGGSGALDNLCFRPPVPGRRGPPRGPPRHATR